MLPKITIVIPFYNCTYIDQAIQSALNQTYANIEIIVVDDGSTVHAEKISPYLNRIHYMRKVNGGTASALNYGIKHASGDYISWLSSDDLFYPNKIEKQVAFMLSRHALFSYTNFDVIDSSNNVIGYCCGQRCPNVIEFYSGFFIGNPVNGCTVMIKRKLLSQHGLFNQALLYTHDYDLWIRMILARLDLHYLDECLTMYRDHEQMGTKKHWPMIEQEIKYVQSAYYLKLTEFINQLKREVGG